MSFSRMNRLLAVVTILSSLGTAGRAEAATVFDVFTDVARNGGLRYQSDAPTHFPAVPGDTVPIEIVSLQLTSVSPVVTRRTPDGHFNVDSFFDIEYRVDHGTHSFVDSFFDVFVGMKLIGPDVALPDRTGDSATIETEILSMNLSGANPGSGNQTNLRISPPPHRGHVTVLKISDPGSGPDQFQVDSFFDVFFEISLDGGASWRSAETNTPLEMHTVYAPSSAVPEPSSLVAFAGLGVMGLVAARRKRRQ